MVKKTTGPSRILIEETLVAMNLTRRCQRFKWHTSMPDGTLHSVYGRKLPIPNYLGFTPEYIIGRDALTACSCCSYSAKKKTPSAHRPRSTKRPSSSSATYKRRVDAPFATRQRAKRGKDKYRRTGVLYHTHNLLFPFCRCALLSSTNDSLAGVVGQSTFYEPSSYSP